MQKNIEVIAELPQFKSNLEQYLQNHGYNITENAQHRVLADARMGSALVHLEQHGKEKPTLILTDNTSVAYSQCLLDFAPEGLLISGSPTEIFVSIELLVSNKTIPHQQNIDCKLRFTTQELRLARAYLQKKLQG